MSGVATFPLLRTPELVSSLVDIGLQHITADEIDRPTAVKVVPIYAWFLSALTQLTLEDVCVAAQLQLDNMEDQEIYRETIYVGALWAVLSVSLLLSDLLWSSYGVLEIKSCTGPAWTTFLCEIYEILKHLEFGAFYLRCSISTC